MLGDALSAALSLVGVTEDSVSQWLGAPCGCKERQEKLNSLDLWARHALKSPLRALHYLRLLTSGGVDTSSQNPDRGVGTGAASHTPSQENLAGGPLAPG